MTSAAQTAPGRILVVDDNEANRDMLRRQLEKQQHEVSTAADGFAALRACGRPGSISCCWT